MALRLVCSLPRCRVMPGVTQSCRRVSSLLWKQGNGKSHQRWKYVCSVVAASGLGAVLYSYGNTEVESSKFLRPLKASEVDSPPPKVSSREERYKVYATLIYQGEPYMSPRDFLESVTSDEPRSHDVTFLDDQQLSKTLKSTPSRRKGSDHLFRDMWNEGILSYADYLFLITAITKTRRQFEVAFRMIDVDGSDFIDQSEFNRVEEAVTSQRDHALIRQKLKQSSLTTHLFGLKGNQHMYSKDFYKFIEDLQTEVLEIEKYSGGSPTICEEDFARILLHHTTWVLEPVFARLKKRPRHETGITFQQFQDFCQLLNSLADFAIAMTMFTIAGKSVTEEEFSRAAQVCIGKPLDPGVVTCVFHIFDQDGDGKLSYREFLAVMKNWKLRGFKMRERKRQGSLSEFKTCVKMEMKNK